MDADGTQSSTLAATSLRAALLWGSGIGAAAFRDLRANLGTDGAIAGTSPAKLRRIARRITDDQARALAGQAGGQPSEQRAAVESELTQAVHNLLVSVEAYPDLKSNTNFLELQRELTDTEDRIAFARQYYNDVVRQWNTKIQSVPTNVLAGMMKAEKAEYFEIQDITAARYSEALSAEDASKPPNVEF